MIVSISAYRCPFYINVIYRVTRRTTQLRDTPLHGEMVENQPMTEDHGGSSP
jgi:hypothetical protein